MEAKWSLPVRERLRNELRLRADSAPWAYQYFLWQLDNPDALSGKTDAVVVFSHDRVCLESRYPGITHEHRARIHGAVRRLQNSCSTRGKHSKLVLLGVTEGHTEARQVAIGAGCPPKQIICLGDLPLRETHTGQQCKELATFATQRHWQHLLLLSSYYHVLRLRHTATQWFTDVAATIYRSIGFVPWPPRDELLTGSCMAEYMVLIEQEIQKTKAYCKL